MILKISEIFSLLVHLQILSFLILKLLTVYNSKILQPGLTLSSEPQSLSGYWKKVN